MPERKEPLVWLAIRSPVFREPHIWVTTEGINGYPAWTIYETIDHLYAVYSHSNIEAALGHTLDDAKRAAENL